MNLAIKSSKNGKLYVPVEEVKDLLRSWYDPDRSEYDQKHLYGAIAKQIGDTVKQLEEVLRENDKTRS